MPPEYSLYFHIPFCTHRCAYCDFNTYAGQEASIPAYVKALCHEIKAVGESAPSRLKVGTIFFGGGTPSLLTPAHYRDIFQAIRRYFAVPPSAEISLEANPGTVSPEALRELREIGFNRISYGVQSADPNELRMLERIHSYSDVVNAICWSRQAGFNNLNLDLIYGLPEQTLAGWQKTVQLVIGLHPEHLSAYALTLEHGTSFGRWASKGLLPIPDPDLAAEMYEWLSDYLVYSGYTQYEISNWALSDESTLSPVIRHPTSFQCRHNLQYWRNLEYLGLGAGAHGYAHGVRYSNVLRIKTYIERLSTGATDSSERDSSQIFRHAPTLNFPLSPAVVNHHVNTLREDMDETMITGLRLTREGVSAARFRRRFGVEMNEIYGTKIERLVKLGLLEQVEGVLRLTRRGRLLGNQVFIEFVGD